MKIIIANTDIQALFKATDTVLDKYGRDDIPENMRGQAVLSALKNMFEGRNFSICKIHDIADMNGVHIPKETNDYFRTLHCVDFADMTAETREFLFAKCVDLFKGNMAMANISYETN